MKTLNDQQEEEEVMNTPEVAALIEQLNDRLRVSKDELVTEIEAHLSDLLGTPLGEAMRAVADRQNIRRADSPNFGNCHKSALVLLSRVLSEASRAHERSSAGRRSEGLDD